MWYSETVVRVHQRPRLWWLFRIQVQIKLHLHNLLENKSQLQSRSCTLNYMVPDHGVVQTSVKTRMVERVFVAKNDHPYWSMMILKYSEFIVFIRSDHLTCFPCPFSKKNLRQPWSRSSLLRNRRRTTSASPDNTVTWPHQSQVTEAVTFLPVVSVTSCCCVCGKPRWHLNCTVV